MLMLCGVVISVTNMCNTVNVCLSITQEGMGEVVASHLPHAVTRIVPKAGHQVRSTLWASSFVMTSMCRLYLCCLYQGDVE